MVKWPCATSLPGTAMEELPVHLNAIDLGFVPVQTSLPLFPLWNKMPWVVLWVPRRYSCHYTQISCHSRVTFKQTFLLKACHRDIISSFCLWLLTLAPEIPLSKDFWEHQSLRQLAVEAVPTTERVTSLLTMQCPMLANRKRNEIQTLYIVRTPSELCLIKGQYLQWVNHFLYI